MNTSVSRLVVTILHFALAASLGACAVQTADGAPAAGDDTTNAHGADELTADGGGVAPVDPGAGLGTISTPTPDVGVFSSRGQSPRRGTTEQ